MEAKLKNNLIGEFIEQVLGVSEADRQKLLEADEEKAKTMRITMLGKRFTVAEAQDVVVRHFEQAGNLIETVTNIYNAELEATLHRELKEHDGAMETPEESKLHRFAHLNLGSDDGQMTGH